MLLAVAGYLGGALPGATTSRVWSSDGGPLTVVLWLLGTGAMVGAWWALRGGAPSTRWAYVTAGLWALPLLVTAPLGSRDIYSYACQGWVYADGGDPYATGVAAAGCPWLETVAPIWRDTPAPYGPFFVLLAALAVVLGGGLAGTLVLLRVLAVAGLLLAAFCLPGLARAAGVPPRRATWLVLACPLVGVHLVAGAHNDAVMLGLLLLGLLLLVRRPHRTTGPPHLAAPSPQGHPSPQGQSSPPDQPSRPGESSPSGESSPPGQPSRPGQLSVPGESSLPGESSPLRQLSVPGQAGRPSRLGQPIRSRWTGQPSGPETGAAGALLAVGWLLVAGVLLGLAVSVKATAVVVLPFAALAAVRGRYTVAALLRDGGTLAVGVLGGLAVTSLLSGLGLGWIGGLGSSGDTEQWTSPPTAVGMVVDYAGGLVGLQPAGVPVARVVALVLLAALLVLLWWRSWSALRRPAGVEPQGVGGVEPRGQAGVEPHGRAGVEPQGLGGVEPQGLDGVGAGAGRLRVVLLGAGLALALTVALAPVFHPWYATWPLAVLAVAAARTTWFVAPSALVAFLALPDGTNLARLAKAPGAVAMTLLVIGVAVWGLPRLRRARELP
ncbi:polyprenol phosphomannose-dependent alpha 1,6 mannosyltransferase MptB [Micromonospora sp. CA-263727]|uniref:polyprenol phosphomannose-dependent alpha 1,6 mannosyltransferase MptB n=1 Tax=Micromonospora sp. CA-263727 TaxID=3239967 RepID=UPI003D944EEA